MQVVGITVVGDSGIEYSVYHAHDGIHCTCPDHKYRQHECKHIRFLRERVAPQASAGTSLVSV